jgi:adenine-specific DNA-methyltransferase
MLNPQRLELTWIGKETRPPLEPRILPEDPAKSCYAQHRTGKVKCIYIDPPYNTDSAFKHNDDGIEHPIWLGFMRSRIELLHKMLAKDGSILFDEEAE